MINVIKADGSVEQFSEAKVISSIKRAGIPEVLQKRVLQSIKDKLYDDIHTYDIYGFITDALAQTNEPFSKARYSLKQSIMLLGPSGFPFEDFIGRILEEHHFQVQTRQVLNGQCVNHEVDVIAEKKDLKVLVEAKFHNNAGTRSDVRVALYVRARFEDLKDRYNFNEAWVVTNTKTTIDANTYASCSGMKMISWNYPEKGSLRDMIEEHHLHPVTMLTTLSPKQKAQLMAHHVVMCKDILQDESLLDILSLSHEEELNTLAEIKYVVKAPHE